MVGCLAIRIVIKNDLKYSKHYLCNKYSIRGLTMEVSSVDKFLEKEFTLDIFVPSSILLISLLTTNLPFSLFYIIVFLHFSSYKNSNYEMYYNFMLTGIIIVAYFFIITLGLSIINMYGSINLHPNSSERPYFYFV
jgi:hypothetical protein